MNDLSFAEIQALDCDSRYEIFLTMVAEQRDIWVLVNESEEFLKIHSEDQNMEYLPVWPHADFTKYYCNHLNDTLTPKCVSVPQFFAKWIGGLDRDGLQIGVFPNGGEDVWIMDPPEFKRDLQDAFLA